MATIEDLTNKSILFMAQDELFLHFREIRNSRRTPKKIVKKSAPKEVEKSPSELIDMLSNEQREAILRRLERQWEEIG